MPAIAGMSDLPYRVFLLFNALGGLVWGITYTALGYSAGAAYGKVAGVAGRAAAIAVAVLVVLALLVWHHRRNHPKAAKRHPDARTDADESGGGGATRWEPDDPYSGSAGQSSEPNEPDEPSAGDGSGER